MKVFLGIYEVAGYFGSLTKGFQENKIEAKFHQLTDHTFYKSVNQTSSFLIALWKKSFFIRSQTSKGKIIRKIVSIFYNELMNFIMIISSLAKYDVFIFSYGITISNKIYEFLLYKLFRKTTIFVFLGSDARPPYIAAKFVNTSIDIDYDELFKATLQQKKKIQLIEKYASFIVNYIPQAHFHTRKFIDALVIGFPVIVEDNNLEKSNTSEKTIKIIHVPSEKNIKGSEEIRIAINNLCLKGYQIDYKVIYNVHNSIVLQELNKCDFIVSELYSDSPLPGIATEAAHLGKPSVIGGYFSSMIDKFYRPDLIPPSLYVHPLQIEKAIEKMIIDTEYRREMGIKVKQFVKNNWNSKEVATKYTKIISGNIIDDWWRTPDQTVYMQGSVPEWRSKQVINKIIILFGIPSLQLTDKPDIENLFVEYARLSANG